MFAASGDAPRTARRRAPARCCSAPCRAARPPPLLPSTCRPKPRQRGGRWRRPAAVALGPTRVQAFNGRLAFQRPPAGAPTPPSRSRTSPWTRVTPRERPDLPPCTPDALLSRAFHDPPSAPISNPIFPAKTALKIYDLSVGFLLNSHITFSGTSSRERVTTRPRPLLSPRGGNVQRKSPEKRLLLSSKTDFFTSFFATSTLTRNEKTKVEKTTNRKNHNHGLQARHRHRTARHRHRTGCRSARCTQCNQSNQCTQCNQSKQCSETPTSTSHSWQGRSPTFYERTNQGWWQVSLSQGRPAQAHIATPLS